MRLFLIAPLFVSLLGCSSTVYGTKVDHDAAVPAPDAHSPFGTQPGDEDAGTLDASADVSGDPSADASDDVDPEPGTGAEGNGNNTGVVDAPILPGREPNTALHKSIDFEVVGDAGELVVGPAFAMRDASSDTSRSATVIAVRSTAAKTRCGIRATSYRVLDAGRAVIADGGTSFLNGSLRANAGSCLGPGETGYFGYSASAPYDSAARVSIALDLGTIDTHVPGARMEMRDAVGAPDSFLSKVTLNFRNVGTHAATVQGFAGNAILSDETGPVAFGMIDDCADSASITALPGDGVTLCLSTFTSARVTRAQGWCSFADK